MKTKLRRELDRRGTKTKHLQKAGIPSKRAYYLTSVGRARPEEKRKIAKLLRRPQRELF